MAKSVVSASKSQRKRARAKMNMTLIEYYLSSLEEALGDNKAFMAIYDRLKANKDATQAEVLAIASQFMSPMPSSTSRSKALEKILARHTNLMSVKLRQRAVGGRSAA